MEFLLQSGKIPGVDGTALHYTLSTPAPKGERGDPSGPCLVFCNGVGMNTALWQHFLAFFRPRVPTLIWDYRGHGLSEFPKDFDALTIEHHAEDLHIIVTELRLHDMVLIGHSMGVQVILETYRLFPEKIRGLVPICGSFRNPLKTFFYTHLFEYAFPFLYRTMTDHADFLNPLWKSFSRTPLAEQVVTWMGTNPAMVKPQDLRPYLENLQSVDLGLFFNALKGATEHSAAGILKSVKVPTLVIAGEWDHFTPLSESKKMAQEIPGAELFVIPHGSHCGLLDQPELLNLKVEKFLVNQIGPARNVATNFS